MANKHLLAMIAVLLCASAGCQDDAGAPLASSAGSRGDSGAGGASGHDSGVDANDIAGTHCDYLCSGGACNLRCEHDVLYRCPQGDRWQVEQDCAATGQECVSVRIPDGMEIEKACAAADNDAGV